MKKFCLLFILFTSCIETDLEKAKPEFLRIVLAGETFRVNEIYQLQAEYTDIAGVIDSQVDVTWSSSDAGIFRIDGNTGIGVSAGTVMITASTQGIEATEEIEIIASQESLTISNFVNRLEIGNQFELGVNYIDVAGEVMDITPEWESLDTTIATVDENGLMIGIRVGMTSIKSSFGNVSDSLMLEIIDVGETFDSEIRITVFKETIKIGENFTFEAVYFGSNGQPDATVSPQWTSSDSSILAIDVTTGVATALVAGETTITASSTSGGGVSDSTNVTVMVNEASSERTGTLMGVGGYNISGKFSLSMNEQNEVILTVSNYNPAGPGPYFYLTNQTNNISNGLALGDARTSGLYTINISDISPDAELHTYGVLMVWCDPFNIRLGYGEFDN